MKKRMSADTAAAMAVEEKEIIEAVDWKDALNQHSSFKTEDIIWPDSLESAKMEAFNNMDMMIDVIEIN